MSKVLIIDDDQNIRTLLRVVHEAGGYTVTEAQDGNMGVREAQKNQPDLAIVDILMPEKEGIQTIHELKNSLTDARILAISGGGRKGEAGFLQLAKKMGADEVLAKPFGVKELTETVQALLAGRR
ncbi:MAG: response regulator [Alphaproteobacteria bacterium]|nr:response regulator [Alphaproteobacteria bacterium]